MVRLQVQVHICEPKVIGTGTRHRQYGTAKQCWNLPRKLNNAFITSPGHRIHTTHDPQSLVAPNRVDNQNSKDVVRARYPEDLQVSSRAPRTEAHRVPRGTSGAREEYYLISERESERERAGAYTTSAEGGDSE